MAPGIPPLARNASHLPRDRRPSQQPPEGQAVPGAARDVVGEATQCHASDSIGRLRRKMAVVRSWNSTPRRSPLPHPVLALRQGRPATLGLLSEEFLEVLRSDTRALFEFCEGNHARGQALAGCVQHDDGKNHLSSEQQRVLSKYQAYRGIAAAAAKQAELLTAMPEKTAAQLDRHLTSMVKDVCRDGRLLLQRGEHLASLAKPVGASAALPNLFTPTLPIANTPETRKNLQAFHETTRKRILLCIKDARETVNFVSARLAEYREANARFVAASQRAKANQAASAAQQTEASQQRGQKQPKPVKEGAYTVYRGARVTVKFKDV